MSAALWDEWKTLTRFLMSAQIAFERERTLWEGLEFASPEQVKISVPVGSKGVYKVDVPEHRDALNDRETLFALILVHSYAIAEAAAVDALKLARAPIETWGEKLLARNGRGWSDLPEGRAGLVEVAVVRNAIAHGGYIDAQSANRLLNAGAPARAVGSKVSLDFDALLTYRGRLQTLLNVGGMQIDPEAYVAPRP